MRYIDKMICSCGGNPVEVETTKKEEKEMGLSCRCCHKVIRCPKCNVKIWIMYEAPEPRYD